MDSFVESPRDPEDFPTQGPLKFYEKCLIEEKKEACFTCLREYFVPDTYCEQAKDYVARSIDKYPAVVYNNGGQIYGPADASITSKGDECATNRGGGNLALSLLCRVMPEYGGGLCRTGCMSHGMTEEELNDITDFRPFDTDCNQARVAGGGKDPWNPINDGARQAKSKCCASFWVHDASVYAECAGAGTGQAQGVCTYGKPVWEEPWCYCEYGWRPLQGVHQPIDFQCPSGGYNDSHCPSDDADANWNACTNACGVKSFTVPNSVYISTAKMITNADTAGSMVFVGQNGCDDPDADNCYYVEVATLLQKFAKIFKPRTPYALAADDCDCWIDNGYCMYVGPSGFAEQCQNDQYCDTSGYSGCYSNDWYFPIPPGGFVQRNGNLKWTGTCDCKFLNGDIIGCPAGFRCDLTAPGNNECMAGDPPDGNNGKCKEVTPGGDCDYMATNPPTICSVETPNTSNAKEYCKVGGINYEGEDTRRAASSSIEQNCDLSTHVGDELYLGVTNDDPREGVTGVALCVQCNRDDAGYNDGRYNTNFDQCWHKE